MCSEYADFERELFEIHAVFVFALFHEVYEVARRASYGGGAEVAHNHQLALGVPAGRRDYRAPHALRAAVQPEAARKEPVAETYLHEIPALDTEHCEASEHRARRWGRSKRAGARCPWDPPRTFRRDRCRAGRSSG